MRNFRTHIFGSAGVDYAMIAECGEADFVQGLRVHLILFMWRLVGKFAC